MKGELRLESPAKINLRLEIIKRREDGYHELKTIFQKISLHDTLSFSLREEKGIHIQTDHPRLSTGGGNLVYPAAHSMLVRSGYGGGVFIHIGKRIPLGAGLGGGSSNAAMTLKALNQLLGMGLNQKELMKMGLAIGADVPFFLTDGPAIGSGIGERLKRIDLPRPYYVLIYPNFEVSSQWVYQNFVLTKRHFHLNLQKLPKTCGEILQLLWNDLEWVVSEKYPEIGQMKEMLLSAGASGAIMTGSGPTVFGLFSSEKKATEAYQRLKRKVRERGWKVILAHGIP